MDVSYKSTNYNEDFGENVLTLEKKSIESQVSLKAILLQRLINDNFSDEEFISLEDKSILAEFYNLSYKEKKDELKKLQNEFYNL